MRERMEQIWGSLEVSSTPESGTLVTARLPLGNTAGPGSTPANSRAATT
jgi:signal transduction histidine kinase